MNKEIYIHIGYPKTGTTFLQKELFPQVKTINYVKLSLINLLLRRITFQDSFSYDANAIKKEIERHISNGKNVISFEGFVGQAFFKFINNKLIADRLSVLFSHAKIIIAIRDQYSLLESIYKQYVQEGGVKGFRRFINFKENNFVHNYRISDLSINPEMFDYLPLIKYYRSLFGKNNIFVIPYELLKNNQEEFVRKLLSWMGVHEIPHYKGVVYNPGYGINQIQIARFCNRFLQSRFRESALIPAVDIPVIGKSTSTTLMKALQSNISFKLFGRKQINDSRVKEATRKKFLDSNREIDKMCDLSLENVCPGYYF